MNNNISLSSCKAKIEWLKEVNGELLEACKETIPILKTVACNCNDDRDCQRCHALRKIKQAISRAEGKE